MLLLIILGIIAIVTITWVQVIITRATKQYNKELSELRAQEYRDAQLED